MASKDALDLRAGEKIRTGNGVETVTSPPQRGGHNTVEIYTDKSTIVTTLPVKVTVVD